MHLSTRSKITAILFIVLSCFLIPIHANAAEISENYYVKRFETRDGLKSAEVNAIIQTDDHYIWVGSYSGLYKYDGLSFSNVLHDKGVLNAMSLYSASDGHLWIRTNDSGVFCYNPIIETVSSIASKCFLFMYFSGGSDKQTLFFFIGLIPFAVPACDSPDHFGMLYGLAMGLIIWFRNKPINQIAFRDNIFVG